MKRALLPTLLFLVSCTSAHKNSEREPALVRAEVRAEGLKAGLALIPERKDQLLCSATYIEGSRRLFLTAAHCIHEFRKGDRVDIARTILGKDGSSRRETIARIADVIPHESFVYRGIESEELDPYDIAVGIADRDFPADMAPASLPLPDWLPNTARGKYFFAGAGASDPAFEKHVYDSKVRTGQYYSELGIVRSSFARSAVDYVKTAPFKEGDVIMMKASDERDPYTCPGDSGGSLLELANGKTVLAGVIFGVSRRTVDGVKLCWWYPFRAAPVSAYLDWIQRNAKKLK